MNMRTKFPVWRQLVIPQHSGGKELVERIVAEHMWVERWARHMIDVSEIPSRAQPATLRIARVSNADLGLTASRSTIAQTKAAGIRAGLAFLSLEDVLALRLAYTDQPPEWMRIAMETYIDEDGSYLALAIVHDGERGDIRTTWDFPENVYQDTHEWFWRLSE